MSDRLVRLCVEDGGQDLIEYALLCGIIGVVGLLIFPEIADKMGAAYQDWVSEISAAWEPCAPGGCGG
jgi:hypothetical protein